MPALKKPSAKAVTKEEKEEANAQLQKERSKAEREERQKETFLQQLGQTQTSLREKLQLYEQAYPAEKGKIDKDFLQDVLNDILKNGKDNL